MLADGFSMDAIEKYTGLSEPDSPSLSPDPAPHRREAFPFPRLATTIAPHNN
jgi:hypothetical protein